MITTIDSDALREYINGFNKIHVNSTDELIVVCDLLKSIGFYIGFNPHDRYSAHYRTVAFGEIDRDKIHACIDPNNMHYGKRCVEFSELGSIFAPEPPEYTIPDLNLLFSAG